MIVVCEGNRRRLVRMIGWEKLEEGWVKLNTDESFREVRGLAGCGEVFRDKYEGWVSGFYYRLSCRGL